MSNLDIIRSWKDKEYRNSLSTEEQATLPPNPAGYIELNDAELAAVVGGLGRKTKSKTVVTNGTCSCCCDCPAPAPAPDDKPCGC